ncbi:MAG: GFA family protein [Parvibaculum sp.]|uniref:GFA family protein n=1 Tax=Parvibaculum sp. TaxID=2024848 RepID=UPI00271EDE7B|nr:GFA family protein [Parvibaculum sp.]MDO8837569.1 GFA family protein [Parvibaculum sp.]
MIEGRCLCGAVRFAIRGGMSGIVICHCSMCRKAAGGAAGAFFVARRDEVTWTGAEYLTSYKSSPELVRAFCLRCGSAMTGANLVEPDETIILAASALDGDIAARIVAQEHLVARASWDADSEKAPHFDGAFPDWETLRP